MTFSERSERGLRISKLSSKSVAAHAEFHEGDVIVSVNDHRVHSERDFLHWIHAGVDERITVIVMRDDREVTLYLEPDVIFEEVVVSESGGWLGVDLVERFQSEAVVQRVYRDSGAERAGLRADDMIVSVDGTEIASPEHLGKVIRQMRPGTTVEIEFDRGGRVFVTDATLGRRPEVARTEIRQERRTLIPRR
jgi:regulator of sigma E protease